MTRDGERAIELISELGSRVGHLLSDMVPPAAQVRALPLGAARPLTLSPGEETAMLSARFPAELHRVPLGLSCPLKLGVPVVRFWPAV